MDPEFEDYFPAQSSEHTCHVCAHVHVVEWLNGTPFDRGEGVGFSLPVPPRCPRCSAPYRVEHEGLAYTLFNLVTRIYGMSDGHRDGATLHVPTYAPLVYGVDGVAPTEGMIERCIEATIAEIRDDPTRIYDMLGSMASQRRERPESVDEREFAQAKRAVDRMYRDAVSGFLEWQLRELAQRLKAQVRAEREHHLELSRRRRGDASDGRV